MDDAPRPTHLLLPRLLLLLLLLLIAAAAATAALFAGPGREYFGAVSAASAIATFPPPPPPPPPPPVRSAPREGIARFDALYAHRLSASVHAPMPADARLAALLPLPPVGGSVAFLGVPAADAAGSSSSAAAERVVVFEPRPNLATAAATAAGAIMAARTALLAEWPLRKRSLAEGSQHRIEVPSPLFLAQLDRADRLRALRCCASWLHPSQGVLVLRFLDGGAATARWCGAHTGNQVAAVYSCWARLGGRASAHDSGAADEAVVYLTERARWTQTKNNGGGGALPSLRDDPATTTYESLVFAASADGGWAEAVRRAGLKVELELRGVDGDEEVVTWVCRRRRE